LPKHPPQDPRGPASITGISITEKSAVADFWRNVQGLMNNMKSSDSDQSFRRFLDSLPDGADTEHAKEMPRDTSKVSMQRT
jgi:hypothetical protein